MIIEHGPSVGEHHGKEIPAYILDDDGTRYDYNRVAVETDGGVELSQLSREEVVIAPGLIYRAIASET
jgi:hypothetical protein